MINKNIFCGKSMRAELNNRIYEKLMQRTCVSYADIVADYCGEEVSEIMKESFSSRNIYSVLKKSFPEVLKAIEKKLPGSIEKKRKGSLTIYKYTGIDDNPLKDERLSVMRKSIEDYVKFCKASSGLLPTVWMASFFENTQLLLDLKNDYLADVTQISSSLEQNLLNIDLLPMIYECVSRKQVISFTYQPFGESSIQLIFHPQYLKEYNGRWFVFGKAENELFYPFTVAIDRIQGDIRPVSNIEYASNTPGFYRHYFQDIVGVSHMEGEKKEHVIIRTLSAYFHGLVLTKPIHISQQELSAFNAIRRYGEISLDIEPNRELIGKLLTYGENIVVMSPLSLRNRMAQIINAQSQLYDVF